MSLGIETKFDPGLTPTLSPEQMEAQAAMLRRALRSVRDVEQGDVVNFLIKFCDEERPNPDRLCKEIGVRWVAVYRAIRSMPELEDYWETLVEAKAYQLMFEILDERGDENMSETDKKSRAAVVQQWVKMMKPERFGDKGGDVNLNINLGDTIDKARIRVVKMRQQVLLASDPVSEAGL